MSWKCRKCGSEVEVRADIVGDYQVYLDKDGNIDDYEDWKTLYTNKGVITLVGCRTCGAFDRDILRVAKWVEEE